MKQLIALVAITFATTSFAADAPKKDTKVKTTVTKCVPSKDVVCDKNLQGKTRPTPKKKAEDKK